MAKPFARRIARLEARMPRPTVGRAALAETMGRVTAAKRDGQPLQPADLALLGRLGPGIAAAIASLSIDDLNL